MNPACISPCTNGFHARGISSFPPSQPAQNVLLTAQGVARIADIGLAGILSTTRSYIASSGGWCGRGGQAPVAIHACSSARRSLRLRQLLCSQPSNSYCLHPADLLTHRPRSLHSLLPPAAVAVGTIAYCSPEQLLGLKCGFASDIYSFGVVRRGGGRFEKSRRLAGACKRPGWRAPQAGAAAQHRTLLEAEPDRHINMRPPHETAAAVAARDCDTGHPCARQDAAHSGAQHGRLSAAAGRCVALCLRDSSPPDAGHAPLSAFSPLRCHMTAPHGIPLPACRTAGTGGGAGRGGWPHQSVHAVRCASERPHVFCACLSRPQRLFGPCGTALFAATYL